MFNPSSKQLRIIKIVLFSAALLPFVRLPVFAFTEQLGANPVEFITRNTGDWTLYMLCITLAITPLRRISGCNWLLKLRRMAGLFYKKNTTQQNKTKKKNNHFFDLQEMLKDVAKRPFIL